MNRSILRGSLVLVAALSLVSCTDNTQVAGVGSGGTGTGPAGSTVGGTVSGFGSIIVNGTRYDDAQATVQFDVQPGTPTAATRNDVRLGMQVNVQADANNVAARVVAAAETIGVVASVTADGRTLVVTGQTVRIDADALLPTVLDGLTSTNIVGAAGSVVEVQGQRAVNGDILATRVARLPAGSTATRVSGSIGTLDTAQQRLTVNGLAVNYVQATVLPAASMLAVGKRVTVWSDLAPAGATLSAKIVRVDQADIPDGASTSLGGVVGAFAAPAGFQLLGVAVDAAGARFVNGTAANLRNGAVVTVTGRFSANVLRATEVRFAVAADLATEISGSIGNFINANATFDVRNTKVKLANNVQYVGGNATNLANDVQVKVQGSLTGGVVQVSRVDFVTPTAGAAVVLPGLVGSYSAAAGTFRMLPWTYEFALDAAAVFRGGARSDLANGKAIVVRGTLAADQTRFAVVEVEFLSVPGMTVDLAGVAEDVEATRFEVGGVDISTDAATQYVGRTNTRADLTNGAAVEVTVRIVNGNAIALRVEVLEPATSRVRGAVRDFVSLANFRVDGQRIDASANPRVTPGNRNLNQIANGVDLEVRGNIVNGTLRANRIKFR